MEQKVFLALVLLLCLLGVLFDLVELLHELVHIDLLSNAERGIQQIFLPAGYGSVS